MNDSNRPVLHGTALLMLLLLSGANYRAAGAPAVSNVHAAQRPGTELVDVTYDLANPGGGTVSVTVAVSTNGGTTYDLPATHLAGALGVGIAPATGKQITWDAGQDWPGHFSSNVRFRVTADDQVAPSGMVLIPAGSFQMGDPLDGESDAPVHSVYVSAFYMDANLVSYALWQQVYQWAISHGYSFDYPGSGKAANHPVQTVDWYDCVKWCNARSEMEGRTPAYYTSQRPATAGRPGPGEMEGRTPAYYTSAGQAAVYRSGDVDVQNNWVNWSAGYRLPTEAEWEKAARGGLSGQRFPWGNTIDWSRANYCAEPGNYAYDINPTGGYDPAFNDGVYPYTSPVGHFAANGYGLYDVAGNVWEWCWDWYGSYAGVAQSDPRGALSGSLRVVRGGSWRDGAIDCRAAVRGNRWPVNRGDDGGFRSVLPPGQP
jgi:formylglycine-generating enzyme required for sulfatase activity